MKITKHVPIFLTTKLAEAKAFYLEHLGFRPTFEGDGFLGLASTDGAVEIAFMRPAEGQPEFTAPTVNLCFEVAEPDAEHERLRAAGLTIIQEPRDNAWGDRSFILADPAGVPIYVYTPIPPSAEFAQYVRE